MKISQIMVGKGFGGAERYFVDLSLALADRGHDVQVICHRDFVGLPLLEARNDIELRTLAVHGKWDPLAPRRIFQLLDAYKPNVVHAHLARGAHIAGKAARRAKLPLVVKTHNYVDLKYYAAVDQFIATTQDQLAYLTSHGIPESRIAVIPNFSRIPPVSSARTSFSRPPVFASLGRMVPKKGFDLLLTAFASLLSSGVDARLLLGGEGPERARLQELAKDLGIADQVSFPGWVDDVPEFLAQGDVFVLPSRDEPFGIAVLEAMASGLPIIATKTKGPLEILDDTTSRLVPTDEAEPLRAAMMEALAQPKHFAQLASAALDSYRTRYAENAVVPQLLALYRKLQSATAS